MGRARTKSRKPASEPLAHIISKARKRKRGELAPLPPLPDKPLQAGLIYTQPEVAAYLRLRNPKTLSVWRCIGRHPELKCVEATRDSNTILYRGEDVIAFLAGKPARKRGRR